MLETKVNYWFSFLISLFSFLLLLFFLYLYRVFSFDFLRHRPTLNVIPVSPAPRGKYKLNRGAPPKKNVLDKKNWDPSRSMGTSFEEAKMKAVRSRTIQTPTN